MATIFLYKFEVKKNLCPKFVDQKVLWSENRTNSALTKVGQMQQGQMLSGQMSLLQLSIDKEEPGKLPLMLVKIG